MKSSKTQSASLSFPVRNDHFGSQPSLPNRRRPVELTVDTGREARMWQFVAVLCVVAVVGHYFWPIADRMLGLSGIYMATFALGRLPRWRGFLVFATFYLAAMSPLILAGSTIMNTSLGEGTMWWLLHGITTSLPILLLRGRAAGFRAALVALLYIVPPFGYVGANNPSILIGLIFPGSSIFGVIGFILLANAIGSFDLKNKFQVRSLAILVLMSLALNAKLATTTATRVPSNWHGFDTGMGSFGGDLQRRMDIANLELPTLLSAEISKDSADHKGEIWFFAEGMIHDWSSATDFFWQHKLKGTDVTAIVGGYEYNPISDSVTSRVYMLGDISSQAKVKPGLDAARAGMTFPQTMWHPWKPQSHFPMHLPGPAVELDGKRVHFNWCYESTIVWPHFLASMESVDVMVSLENRWLTWNTSLDSAQNVAGRLNARWLGVPLLQAINR